MIFEELRSKTGLSQIECAERLGMSISKYNRIRKGEQHPSITEIVAASKVFNVSEQEIFKEFLQDLPEVSTVNEETADWVPLIL